MLYSTILCKLSTSPNILAGDERPSLFYWSVIDEEKCLMDWHLLQREVVKNLERSEKNIVKNGAKPFGQ